jgi:hypothetical protein
LRKRKDESNSIAKPIVGNGMNINECGGRLILLKPEKQENDIDKGRGDEASNFV